MLKNYEVDKSITENHIMMPKYDFEKFCNDYNLPIFFSTENSVRFTIFNGERIFEN